MQTDTRINEWTDPDTIAAWRTWGRTFGIYTRPLTELLVQAASVGPGMQVLDLASGAGEPAIALAQAVSPSGEVVATDVSESMLEVVRQFASEQRLNNVTARVANAEALPFASGMFDRVTSRLGMMHVPDSASALAEARRVLRPRGRAAFLVWGPPAEQTMMLHQPILARHAASPQAKHDAPGPFRFARPGSLAAALLGAGFADVIESTHRVALVWPGTPEEWWQQTQDVAAPLRHLLAGLSPAARAQIDLEVRASLLEYAKGGHITLQAVVHVATGQAR